MNPAMSDAQHIDQAFILHLTEIVVRNLKNENFRINHLAREAGMSSSTLNRRLNKITGKSGNQFIREVRLRKAHEMLQEKSANVSEVSYAVGFSSPAYFSACFHEHFGYPPSKVTKESTFSLPDNHFTDTTVLQNRKKSLRDSPGVYQPWIVAALLAAIGLIIFTYIKVSGRSSLDDLRATDGRIPVAVMPFDNLTGNRTWDCIQINLISYLSNFDELSVRQKETVEFLLDSRGITGQASITPLIARSISKKLDSKVYISGIISHSGTRSRINVQIVNAKNGEVIKSLQVENHSDEDEIFSTIDSVSTLVKNFLVTAKMISEAGPDLRPYRYTGSPVAYEYFLRADEALRKRDTRTSLSLYLKSVEADSAFIPAIVFLSMRYGEIGDYAEAKKWCLKAYSLKDNAHLDKYVIEWYHATLFGTPEDEIVYLRRYVNLDDNVPVAYWQIGNAYSKLSQYNSAIPEFEKTLEIYKKWGVRPMMINNYITLIKAFDKTQQVKKERKLIEVAAKDFPEDSWMLWRYRAILAFAEGDTTKGNSHVEEYRSAMAARAMPAAEIQSELASLYTESEIVDKAEKSLRDAYSLSPDNPKIINDLAYLLIDKELNIEEGLRLATEGLLIRPDDPILLHTLGWGLARSGRYQEALEVLNKSWDSRPGYNLTLLQHIGEVKRQISSKNQVISTLVVQ